jgi:hypothetical protein
VRRRQSRARRLERRGGPKRIRGWQRGQRARGRGCGRTRRRKRERRRRERECRRRCERRRGLERQKRRLGQLGGRGGNGHGRGTPGTGGTGGEPASSGGESGATNEGGAGTLGPDPDPVTPDDSGVVATSSRYLVFKQAEGVGDVATLNSKQLTFLDLDTLSSAQINVPNTQTTLGSTSPDGQYYVYAQGDGLLDNDLYLQRFTPMGYVPGVLADGFKGKPGAHRVVGWDSSARFSGFIRNSPTDMGIDIVDAARNVHHYVTAAAMAKAAFFDWAPVGYLFHFGYDFDVDHDYSGDSEQHFVAKLTNDGASEPEQLPAAAQRPAFTADGKRLFFAVRPSSGVGALGYVDAPNTPQLFFSPATAAELPRSFVVEFGGESVLGVRSDGSGGVLTAYRFFVDPARAPVAVSDPAHVADELYASATRDLAAITYSDASEQRLEVLRGSERLPVGTFALSPNISVDWVGDVLFYSVGDSELHAVSVGDTGLVDELLNDATETRFACHDLPHPAGKLAVRFAEPKAGFLFLDLTGASVAVLRSVLVSDDTALPDCPVWDPTGSGLAYVEQSDTGSKLFVVSWGEAGPSEPTLVEDAAVTLELVNARLPE